MRPRQSSAVVIPLRLVCCITLKRTVSKSEGWLLTVRRIRKKYRTKIKRMARDRARKLLHSLGCDTPEEQDDTEASDDEEVP